MKRRMRQLLIHSASYLMQLDQTQTALHMFTPEFQRDFLIHLLVHLSAEHKQDRERSELHRIGQAGRV